MDEEFKLHLELDLGSELELEIKFEFLSGSELVLEAILQKKFSLKSLILNSSMVHCYNLVIKPQDIFLIEVTHRQGI